MRTLLWSPPRWRRFLRELSAFEARRFFSLGPADRQILRRRIRTRARFGAAIQLGFVRMTGTTLDTLDHAPRAVLAHGGGVLSFFLPETVGNTVNRRGPCT